MKKQIIFLTTLVLTCVSLYSMESVTPKKSNSIEIGRTLTLIPKDYSFIDRCFYPQEDIEQLHPCFSPQYATCSFANSELVWAREMKEIKILPKEIINYILTIRYFQHTNLEKKHLFFSQNNCTCCPYLLSCSPILKHFDQSFWLNESEIDFIFYLKDYAQRTDSDHMIIDGSNKETRQHFENILLNLPPIAKNNIDLGNYYIKTSKPSLLNGCLGLDKNARARRETQLTTAVGFCVTGALACLSYYAYTKIDDNSTTGQLFLSTGFGCGIGGF